MFTDVNDVDEFHCGKSRLELVNMWPRLGENEPSTDLFFQKLQLIILQHHSELSDVSAVFFFGGGPSLAHMVS